MQATYALIYNHPRAAMALRISLSVLDYMSQLVRQDGCVLVVVGGYHLHELQCTNQHVSVSITIARAEQAFWRC